MSGVTRYLARFIDRFGDTEAWFETDGRVITFSFRGLVFSTGDAIELIGLELQGDPQIAAGLAAVSPDGQLLDLNQA